MPHCPILAFKYVARSVEWHVVDHARRHVILALPWCVCMLMLILLHLCLWNVVVVAIVDVVGKKDAKKVQCDCSATFR
jgi:hypothetical protein